MDKSTKKDNRAFTFAELMISLIVISVLGAILYPTIAQFTPNSNKLLFKSAYKIFDEIMTEIVNEQPNGELGTYDNAGNFTALTPTQLCVNFCEKANVLLSDNNTCAAECASTAGNKTANSLTTSNGMRWVFYNFGAHTNPAPQNGNANRNALQDEFGQNINTFQIFVDVNSSNNELTQLGVGCPNRNVAMGNGNVNMCQLFISNCTGVQNGNCGVFYFDNSTNQTTGIYNTIPNFANGNNTRAEYLAEHLKIQDTFEILVDRNGKIVAMSPAAWANLEDRESD